MRFIKLSFLKTEKCEDLVGGEQLRRAAFPFCKECFVFFTLNVYKILKSQI